MTREHIALLPRSLTRMKIGRGEHRLSQARVAALPPALTSIPYLGRDRSDPEPLFFDHLPELRDLAHENPSGLVLTLASIKRLPSKLHSLYCAADLDEIKTEDWPPLLTKLRFDSLTSTFPIERLPAGLHTLSLSEPIALPMSMIGKLPRSLVYLRAACRLSDPRDIDFPPNLLCLSLSHASTLESCFPLHLLPRSLTELTLPCAIPASQLIHLPPRLVSIGAANILEDAAFAPNDVLCLSRMTDLFKIGEMEGLYTPSSHGSLPASPASLLPRTLRSIITEEGYFWKECDWRRLPSSLRTIKTPNSKHPVSARLLFMEASLPSLTEVQLPLTDLTDDVVKAMPRSLSFIFAAEPHCRWPAVLAWHLRWF